MTERDPGESEVYRFIQENIDSVPHLEALLLLWNSRPETWSAEALAARLYIQPGTARDLLQDLLRSGLIGRSSQVDTTDQYSYQTKGETSDELIAAVDNTYRRHIVPISTMIHSKASSAVRDFARAFRFKKD